MRLVQLVSRLNSSVGGGALFIALFSILSKLLGLVRDRILAGTFGASNITDVYFAAFRLPDFIFNILVMGALTSSFIPVFVRVYGKSKEEGLRVASSMLNLLLIVMAALTIGLIIAAPWITPWFVPGFASADVHLTVRLTRIILLSVLFFTFSNVLSGVLNSWKKFFSFSLSSAIYNVGIIFGITFLYPMIGVDGLAWGVVLGSVLHCGVQLVEAWRLGWRYIPHIAFDAHVKRIVSLMIPRMIGLAGNQIDLTVTTIIASMLGAGSLAVFSYANNLQSFPVSIFGISLAVAAFPSFSQSFVEKDTRRFTQLFGVQFRRIIYFLIPISFSILLLRAQIVRVVLGTGQFDWSDTRLTAQVLGYFALSLVAQGLIPLLARSFYAFEDTRTPVKVSIIAILIDIVLNVTLSPILGVVGLALAFAIASTIQCIALFILLHRRFGDLDDERTIVSVTRTLIASVLSAAVLYLVLQVSSGLLDTRTFVGIFTQGVLAGVAGLFSYITLTALLNADEVQAIRAFIRDTLRPLTNGRA